jgi:hypothetical protein
LSFVAFGGGSHPWPPKSVSSALTVPCHTESIAAVTNNPMAAIAQKYSARGFILNGSERLTTASTD